MKAYSRPSKPTHKGSIVTAAKKFIKGSLIQNMFSSLSKLNCCNLDSTHDYETNWRGHQPLGPNTWTSADDDASSMSVTEQRIVRRRKSRGMKTEDCRRRDSITHIPSQDRMPTHAE